MLINQDFYIENVKPLAEKGITTVAVSKTKPPEAVMELYNIGHRDFGENYVQELLEKHSILPADIKWHFIGHLQTNKVKLIIPFVHLIHSIDSLKLLQEVEKQANKIGRTIDILLQVHIAKEQTKYGLSDDELKEIINVSELSKYKNVNIRGLMGMASFTEDVNVIQNEFQHLKNLFDQCKQKVQVKSFNILSMGMSSDYTIAVREGATMLRIGSLLFGSRSAG